MPSGATAYVEATGPTFQGLPGDPAPAGFGDPGAGSEPETAPYVRVAPSEDFDTVALTVTDSAVRIAGRESQRRVVRVRNYGASDVFIARSQTALSLGNGYPLKADERKLLETQQEVWAVCNTGDTTDVRIIAEYEVQVVTS